MSEAASITINVDAGHRLVVDVVIVQDFDEPPRKEPRSVRTTVPARLGPVCFWAG